MPIVNPFFYVFMFVSVLALSEGLLYMAASRKADNQQRVVRARLKRYAARIENRRTADEAGSIFFETGTRGPIVTLLAGLVPNRRGLDLWLYRSGVAMQLESFLGVVVLSGLLGYVVAISLTDIPALAALGVGLGLLPYLYVRRKKQARMDAFVEEFPEAIDLLCRSLQAGHPLQTGLRLVAEEAEEPVASELSQVVDEIAMGLDIRIALSNLATRMNTQEMPFFINALLIQRETGGDLPTLLTNLAHTSRERLQFKTKVEAIVSQTATSANVLASFPLAFILLISWAAPGYLDPLLTEDFGRMLLLVAFLLTVVGRFLCGRLTRVEI